jgi:hypothetical protein
MEGPCQLDQAVGHRLLAVQGHKVVVVEVVRDPESQAVLRVGVAPEIYGPDGLPDLLDQRDGLGGEVTPLLLPGCARTPSHYPLAASSRMCLPLF